MIKLSIITVNLNNAEGLQKTLASVAKQTFNDYEHVIIDGGSTDGSVEIIKEYETNYNGKNRNLYWVSEPDTGIYNAMNKGIKIAKGCYLQFLNSGDWLADEHVLKKIFEENLSTDLICANSILVSSNSKSIKLPPPKALSFYTFYKDSISHSATLIKSYLFEKIGYYNEELKIASDWEFFIKAFVEQKCSYSYIDVSLTCFQLGGISNSIENFELLHKERKIVLNEYSFFLKDYRQLDDYLNDSIIQQFCKIKRTTVGILFSKILQRVRINIRSIVK